jgi:uncharacterized damage-inducible protein DinB
MGQRGNLILTPLNGYAGDVGVWLSALQDTRQRTLRVLETIEPHWLDFVPEDGESIGTILYHIAAIEVDWLHEDILQTPFPPEIEALVPYDVRDANGKLTPVSESLKKHLERLNKVRKILLDNFLNMSPGDFLKARSLPDSDVSPLYVIHHLMQHEAEHRSQINWIGMKAKLVLSDRMPKEK